MVFGLVQGQDSYAVAEGGSDADEGREVPGKAIVSGRDAPEILEAAEHAFDGVAMAVKVRREAAFLDAEDLRGMSGTAPLAAIFRCTASYHSPCRHGRDSSRRSGRAARRR